MHAEDYFDLTRWVDICHGCHQSLHKRFNQPAAWRGRLDRCGVVASHWARLVSPARFDLASLLRARGAKEPTWEAVTTLAARSRRRPRQRFGEMGIPPGARLVQPRAPELEVRVVDDDRLIWRGEDHSLTSLTAKLTREMGLPTSRDLWAFEGRSLGVIYDETYGERAEAG